MLGDARSKGANVHLCVGISPLFFRILAAKSCGDMSYVEANRIFRFLIRMHDAI